jgi:DNA-binding transcriptional ArsR family regulator
VDLCRLLDDQPVGKRRVTAARLDCVSPDRSPEELRVLRQRLADHATNLRRTSEHFALLAGETRLKIIHLLVEAGELCVCDLATILEMTPAAVSQHLSRLRSGRMVVSRRDGMTIYYRMADAVDPSQVLPETSLKTERK